MAFHTYILQSNFCLPIFFIERRNGCMFVKVQWTPCEIFVEQLNLLLSTFTEISDPDDCMFVYLNKHGTLNDYKCEHWSSVFWIEFCQFFHGELVLLSFLPLNGMLGVPWENKKLFECKSSCSGIEISVQCHEKKKKKWFPNKVTCTYFILLYNP